MNTLEVAGHRSEERREDALGRDMEPQDGFGRTLNQPSQLMNTARGLNRGGSLLESAARSEYELYAGRLTGDAEWESTKMLFVEFARILRDWHNHSAEDVQPAAQVSSLQDVPDAA